MPTNHLPGAKAVDYWQGRQTSKRGGKTVIESDGEPLLPALKVEAATDMYVAACNLIHKAHTMRSGGQEEKQASEALAKKWFGDRVNQEKVTEKVETMVDFLTKNRLKVRFARNKQVLGAYDPDFQTPKVVQLGKPILFKRYSWGEKVMTFLHEMSHAILGTFDKGLDSQGKAKPAFVKLGAVYGPFALQLGKDQLKSVDSLGWAHAIDNAENWGYFLVSHHTLVPNDWLGIKTGRDFSRLDDNTLKDVNSYVKGRPEMPGPSGNTGNVGESWTQADAPLYDLTIIDAPAQYTTQ